MGFVDGNFEFVDFIHVTCYKLDHVPFSQAGLATMAHIKFMTASKLVISPFCNLSHPKTPTKHT